MGSNAGEDIKIPASNATACSETTVEIKIKTLDSRTFTLRVDKCVPVPELKQQIASITGILSEQQRLICRGRVLKDDQRLSAYRILLTFYVEDGHTLHLIVRQPVAPSSELPDNPGDSTPTTGHNLGNRMGPGMVVGTFNVSDQGDGAFPDLNRIFSAVLHSFGITRPGSGAEGIDLNQPSMDRHSASSSVNGTRNSSRQPTEQAASLALPVESLQLPIIPDSLTTLVQYLDHLRQEFIANAGVFSTNARNVALDGSDGRSVEAAGHFSEPRGLITPESLAEVITYTRQLLTEQAADCLMQLAGHLETHSRVMDPLERSRIQSNAMRSGTLFQNFGSLLLELGRAIMTLRMGQTPADALVNAGPAVFVSSTGPNPIMVQPLPFQPGASFGSVPVGTVQHGSGLAGGSPGTGFLPRNIDIRIRAGSLFPRREPTGSQPQQVGPLPSNTVIPGQQDTGVPDLHSLTREPQTRAVPIRTVVAAVPASVRRDSDSSRGSIGILYPVLARVQNASLGNSIGTRASPASGQQHRGSNGNPGQTIPDSATQRQNSGLPAGSGYENLTSEARIAQGLHAQTRGGFEQMLGTMLSQEHALNDNVNPLSSASGLSQTEATQSNGLPTVTDQGVLLSNILRGIMPMLSESTEAQAVPSSEGANSDETQTDDDQNQSSRLNHSSQSQPSPKRRRLE